MDETVITDYAHALMQAHGQSAIVEAAHRAVACEQDDDREGARIWRRVEAALQALRGPRTS